MSLTSLFTTTRQAATSILTLTDSKRNMILLDLADAIEEQSSMILQANKIDLEAMQESNPMYDRLKLTEDRLKNIASDMRNVAYLPSPLNQVLSDRVLPNGLIIKKVSVPYGVIGIIYEARPNVTFDVFSLCFKSGSACILKGGHDADHSNQAAVSVIHDVLTKHQVSPYACTLLPATHEATSEMLKAVGYIDLIIPRGGSRLIRFVRENAQVPCIETGAGVVNTYIDNTANLQWAQDIIMNAKTRRPSVCNTLDCLIIHKDQLSNLPFIVRPLESRGVELHADTLSYQALQESYQDSLLIHATEEDWGTEYLSLRMAIRTVNSIEEAIEHIANYGSGHSEAIVTDNPDHALLFQTIVDAACVYVNAPTSFTDGAQFGLGAEIGISTQKMGARGPMGLQEITTYKWLIEGQGQIRS